MSSCSSLLTSDLLPCQGCRASRRVYTRHLAWPLAHQGPPGLLPRLSCWEQGCLKAMLKYLFETLPSILLIRDPGELLNRMIILRLILAGTALLTSTAAVPFQVPTHRQGTSVSVPPHSHQYCVCFLIHSIYPGGSNMVFH